MEEVIENLENENIEIEEGNVERKGEMGKIR